MESHLVLKDAIDCRADLTALIKLAKGDSGKKQKQMMGMRKFLE